MAKKNTARKPAAAAAALQAPVVTVDFEALKARAAKLAADPKAQKVGLAAGGAVLGALAYHALAS